MPEKYAYGLDHKGLGDIAYERLDIENGDTNELSRNLENFYEEQYLKQVEPGMLEELKSATKSFEKHVGDPSKVKTASKAMRTEFTTKPMNGAREITSILPNLERSGNANKNMSPVINICMIISKPLHSCMT